MHKIKEFRIKKGLSQAKLADLIGITRQSLWGYEHGLIDPSIDNLVKIAVALDCTVDDILDFQAIQDQVHQMLFETVNTKDKEPKN